jgi:hypothetical protein
MKRIFLALSLCAGMLFLGVVNAAAYCSLDPTIGVGLPIHTNVKVHVSLLGISTDLYVHNTSRTTTFGGGIGLP